MIGDPSILYKLLEHKSMYRYSKTHCTPRRSPRSRFTAILLLTFVQTTDSLSAVYNLNYNLHSSTLAIKINKSLKKLAGKYGHHVIKESIEMR